MENGNEKEEQDRVRLSPPSEEQLGAFEEHDLGDYQIQQRTPTERLRTIQESLRLQHLGSETRKWVEKLVTENTDRFFVPEDPLAETNAMVHTIPITDSIPVFIRQYPYSPTQEKEISEQVRNLENPGIIVPSTSSYNSPLWVVPKKADSKGNKH